MKLHQYYKYFIIFISILEVLQVVYFLHASLFFQLLTLPVNFNFQPPPQIYDAQLEEREHAIEEWKGKDGIYFDCYTLLEMGQLNTF